MTIAAGILCKDGIVLCADTELASNSLRTNRSKIFAAAESEHVHVAVAASGDYDFASAAVEYTDPLMRDIKPDTKIDNVRNAFEDAISDLYQNHIWKNPTLQRDFSLLVAVWSREEGFALFKTVETVILRVTDFDVLGTGGDLADYILKKSYRDNITVSQAVAFSAHMLAEVKNHGQGCGGETNIATLTAKGYSQISVRAAGAYETAMYGVEQLTRNVTSARFDPATSDEQYVALVDRMATALRALPSPFTEPKQEKEGSPPKPPAPNRIKPKN